MNFLRKLGFFERRGSKRISPIPPLKGVCSCSQFGQEGFLVYLVQASSNGALVSVNKQNFHGGVCVELRFSIPGRPEELILQGKVLRSWRQGGQGWYSSVIKFSAQSAQAAQILYGYVTHRIVR